MYPHSPLWHYLWIGPRVLQVIIVYVVLYRRLYVRIPAFLFYTLFIATMQSILFVLDHDPGVAYREYWLVDFVSTAISIVLRFAVTYEIFLIIFRPYPALHRLSRVLMWLAAILLLLAAVLVSGNTTGPDLPVVAGMLTLDRGVSLIQSGLLFFLFVFSSYFRLSWRSYVLGIAIGMGIFSAVNLAVVAIRIARGPGAGGFALDFVNMIAYHCSVVIWLVYVLVPERQPASVPTVPDHNLDQWNRELQRLL